MPPSSPRSRPGRATSPQLRACVSAGEALPADIFRRWKEKTGTVILDGIGSTEALHIFIGNRLDDYRPGTSGKPVPGYEVRILDENGKPVVKGESGAAVDPGRIGRQVLLEQAGEDRRDHGRRLAQHRRHLPRRTPTATSSTTAAATTC